MNNFMAELDEPVTNAPIDEAMLQAQLVIAEHVNDLLASWHQWSSNYTLGHGFPSVNMNCRQSRTSRQYDDANGGLDAHIDHLLMEAVDGVIDSIEQPWRTALSVQARNLATGYSVWTSPRLPSCRDARAVLVADARKKFYEGLARGDLI